MALERNEDKAGLAPFTEAVSTASAFATRYIRGFTFKVKHLDLGVIDRGVAVANSSVVSFGQSTRKRVVKFNWHILDQSACFVVVSFYPGLESRKSRNRFKIHIGGGYSFEGTVPEEFDDLCLTRFVPRVHDVLSASWIAWPISLGTPLGKPLGTPLGTPPSPLEVASQTRSFN